MLTYAFFFLVCFSCRYAADFLQFVLLISEASWVLLYLANECWKYADVFVWDADF